VNPPDRLDPRVARTRDVVLSATAELLADEGFDRITIEAIAERCEVARSTIYRNWPNRADLLVAAFERLCAFRDPPDTGDLELDLLGFGAMLAEGLTSERWGRALPSLLGAVGHDDELRTAQQQFSDGRRRVVVGLFDRAVARGEVSRDVDLDVLATLYVSGFFFRRLVSHQPLDARFVSGHAALVSALARGEAPLSAPDA
jgi:AcrR family transcriptional regulator